MPRLVFLAALLGVANVGLAGDAATAAPKLDALKVEDAPPPAPRVGAWQKARVIYEDDFEGAVEGAHPFPWKFNRVAGVPNPRRMQIRRTQGGGHVIHTQGAGGHWIRWSNKLVGGKLRVQFDLLRLGGSKGWGSLNIHGRGEPADYGWDPITNIGPYFRVKWPSGQFACEDSKEILHAVGTLPPDRWHRIVIIADMERNVFRVTINGKGPKREYPFRNPRWFDGADSLAIGGDHLLLDNASVRYLPGDGKQIPRKPARAPLLTIPVGRLAAAPKLDGRLEDAWKQAWHTDRFFRLDGTPANEPYTEVWLGCGDGFLYLATRVRPKDMARIRNSAKSTTGRIWNNIEIFIDPSGATRPGKYLHFFLNPAGRLGQEQGMGGPLKARWEVVSRVTEKEWICEARFPLVELIGACPPENVWGINVCRGKDIGPDFAALSPTYGNFHVAPRFARLTGLADAVATAMRCELAVPEPAYTGEVALRAKLSGGNVAPGRPLKLVLDVKAPDGSRRTEEFSFRRGRGAGQDLIAKVTLSAPGNYYFQAKVYPASADKGLPLAVTPLTYAYVQQRGALDTRTDRNYYTHEKVARIRCTLLGRDVPAGSTARLRVRNKGAKSSDKPLSEITRTVSASPFTMELPLRGLPFEPMELDLALTKPSDTNPLSETTFALRRYPPHHNEVKIRWDNVILINDEPFFPLFAWGDNDIVVKAHDFGCNAYCDMWHGHLNKELLTMARRFNVRGIVGHCTPNQIASAPGKLLEFRDEVPILAWFMEDEPGTVNGRPHENLAKLIEVTRKYDPYHPTYVNLSAHVKLWESALAYGLACDVIGSDPYAASSGQYRAHEVPEHTKMLVKASRGRRPIWQVLQVHFYPDNLHAHPTPAEFRHMAYSAIVHGATGLGLWGTGQGAGGGAENIRGLLSSKALYDEVKVVMRALRRLSPVLVSDEPVGEPALCLDKSVTILNRRLNGRLYVWLVNPTESSREITLRLPKQSGTLVNEVRPGGRFKVEGGSCRLNLQPLQPMVLRLDG